MKIFKTGSYHTALAVLELTMFWIYRASSCLCRRPSAEIKTMSQHAWQHHLLFMRLWTCSLMKCIKISLLIIAGSLNMISFWEPGSRDEMEEDRKQCQVGCRIGSSFSNNYFGASGGPLKKIPSPWPAVGSKFATPSGSVSEGCFLICLPSFTDHRWVWRRAVSPRQLMIIFLTWLLIFILFMQPLSSSFSTSYFPQFPSFRGACWLLDSRCGDNYYVIRVLQANG